jgi:two-component sensor histidine kinase/DNA-binding response OmpR family regulator
MANMVADDKVNILMVDDQPGKLLSYEVILGELGENLIKAGSAAQALEFLLKTDIAVILVDVCMPETDGFELVSMIREHPRFQETAIIFISAVQLADVDHLRAYAMGAVDYVPVPVVAEVLRAKVKVFVELYRKTRQLEAFNRELESRVAERTAALESSNAQLLESERRRSLALRAGNMGSWDLDPVSGSYTWDEGQYRLYGVAKSAFVANIQNVLGLVHADDQEAIDSTMKHTIATGQGGQMEFRIIRPDGEQRWCLGTVAVTSDSPGQAMRLSGCTVDITERKLAEERQVLLAREVDHRAKNALAVVQSLVRLTRAETITDFVKAVDGRVRALASVHTLLSESRWEGASLRQLVDDEMAPYQSRQAGQIYIDGSPVLLLPAAAQTFALALHELATNAAKYGALSTGGCVKIKWEPKAEDLVLSWEEEAGAKVEAPSSKGFGLTVIKASIEGQLSGKVSLDWRPSGLRCRFSIPHAKVMRLPDHKSETHASDEKPAPEIDGPALEGRRILVAEDEVLVGMMVHDMLVDFGFQVVGPIPNLESAFVAAKTADLDGAVLDVNLGGELIYPAATVLAARGIPFVFVTGYDGDSIDERFAHVPLLRKPIEPQLLQRLLAAKPASAVA